ERTCSTLLNNLFAPNSNAASIIFSPFLTNEYWQNYRLLRPGTCIGLTSGFAGESAHHSSSIVTQLVQSHGHPTPAITSRLVNGAWTNSIHFFIRCPQPGRTRSLLLTESIPHFFMMQ